MSDMIEFVEDAKEWAREVGEIQKENLNGDFEIQTKGRNIDLVTEIDKRSEKIIKERINEKYPDHSILAEESDFEEKESEYTWIIDPIDGTSNYANGSSLFCVSIGLKKGDKMVAGCIHIPMMDETYTAFRGKGAYLNGREISVSENDDFETSIIATGFPRDRKTSDQDNVENFRKLIKRVGHIRRNGTAAFELCMVAKGVFDGYWETKLSPWDVAAGTLIVKEAGGRAINLEGEEIEDNGEFIIAGNQKISEKIREVIMETDS